MLNTWEEICTDENARLRTNTLIFTFAITCFFLIMTILTLISGVNTMTLQTLLLGVVSFSLFSSQLRNKEYSVLRALMFGIMAMGMSVYFLYIGLMNGLGFMWLFIVPNVAAMVVDTVKSILYNIVFLIVLLLLLHTPLRHMLLYSYSDSFRVLFPIAMFFEMLCIYIAEIVRYSTHKRLVDSTNRLQSFAFTDPLTGAYNRRALYSHFGDSHANAYGLTFAMIDLDYFKVINDRHGHDVGDKMLCHIVKLISDNAPPNATLYRWGGEEFLLVLKTSDQGEAGRIMSKLCSVIGSTPLLEKGRLIAMTVSIGCMCAEECSTMEESIQQADSCLYKAKSEGRNRLVCA